MRLRPTLIALAATALLAASALAAAPATAAPPGCSIEDFSPHEIVFGAETAKLIQFDLETDCAADEDVNWYLTVREPGGTGPFGWLLRANFPQEPNSRYQYAPDGFASVPRIGGNAFAGAHDIQWQAFLGEETGNPDDYMYLNSTIFLRRATTFSRSFDASPEPVKRGQTITITGTLRRANWDAPPETDVFEGFAAPVALQFRPETSSKYKTVATLQTAADGSVTTTVKAKRSGTWRLRYLGDAVSGASRSTDDFVKVTP